MAKGFGEAKSVQKNSSKPSSLLRASDCEQIQQQWAEHFENLTDPRGKQGVLHPFMSIVMIAILATIGGAKGWEDIEIYGVSHENWLSSFLNLPFGIPTADTYRRLFEANHPTFYQEVEQWFKTAQASDFQGIEYSHDVRVESGHHRREKREVTAVALNQMGGLYKQAQWSGLQTIVRVIRTRHLWNKTEKEVMFYLSSLPPDAQRLGKAIRQHWSIENQLHWVLDVTLRCDPAEVSSAKERAPREGEDACRIRTGNAPENIALLKRWSINLLNQETSFKRSTRQKARRASMDVGYLLKVLEASIPLHCNRSDA